MKTRILVLPALVAMSIVGAGTATASPVQPANVAAYINTLGSMGNFGQYVVGWQFNLSAGYSVTSLGYFDDGQNGFNEPHNVGIYACTDSPCSTGSLLVSATVTSPDPLYNGFRWADLQTPFTLSAGHYVIAGNAGTENYQWTGGTVTFDPRVTWVEGRYVAGSVLDFPDLANPNPRLSYFGPNFAGVPEPGTVFLMGGAVLLLGVRRLRRKA